MSDTFDYEPDPFEDEQSYEVACRYCGKKGLVWVDIGGRETERWRLFNQDKYAADNKLIEGKIHICKPKRNKP